MRQRPGPDELARLAAAILGGEPVPDDPKDRSYAQRMALKALSIAVYDREHGTADIAEEIELFAALYGEEVVKGGGQDDTVRINALNMVLVDQIRAGVWDEATAALKALLMAQIRARLARANPKYLKARMPED
jgi:hypothetical protein